MFLYLLPLLLYMLDLLLLLLHILNILLLILHFLDHLFLLRCGVCNEPLLLDSDTISWHLSNNKISHRMSHKVCVLILSFSNLLILISNLLLLFLIIFIFLNFLLILICTFHLFLSNLFLLLLFLTPPSPPRNTMRGSWCTRGEGRRWRRRVAERGR